MQEFAQMSCSPVKKDSPKLTEQEITQLLARIPGWFTYLKEEEPRLERKFDFPDFDTALDFTNLIAHEAAVEDHHPAILTEWGKVTVTWWTHAIKGLHQNDFIMAARTEKLFAEIQSSQQ